MLGKRKRQHTLRTLNSFHFDKIVGSGTFGVVFKGKANLTVNLFTYSKQL